MHRAQQIDREPMTDPTMHLPSAGDLFARRFLVEGPVASGGMGVIFRAVDRDSGKPVALKLLQNLGGATEIERFRREAGILDELRHPHIVSYVAHGLDETGRRYLAMEWLDGEDLAQRLRRGPLPLSEAMALLHGVSAALAEAHAHGVVHRDIKPSNLFLRGGDPAHVAVLDFGIARRTLQSGILTRTGALIGTPEYMSTEQARGAPDIGPAADIFSLGSVFYECLAGEAPFSGEHVAAVLVKVLFEEPRSLTSRRTDVPQALGELVTRMLRKDPRDRFAHGQALHEAVRRIELPTEAASIAIHPTIVAPLALTPQEQQIFSLAVALPRTDATTQATESADQHDPQLTLQQRLRDLGADALLLADGTIVATVFPSASVSDQVLVAARCGLMMKERLPDHAIAVATGRGQLRGQMPIGEAMGRALELLRATEEAAASATGVWLDTLSENLLAGRLRVAYAAGRTLLSPAQDATIDEDIRRLLGQPTPCVGREQELATLATILETCISDSEARAVGVLAPPGMGKSRLRHETLRAARLRHPELLVVLGRGDIMHAGAPYGLLAQGLRRLSGLVGGESEEVQRERLRARLVMHLSTETADATIGFLGELCGVRFPGESSAAMSAARHDPRVMHDHVTMAFLGWLRAELDAHPVLLVLEDLHWGDALTTQLLEQALRELRDLPLCILALARPEVQELFPAFWDPAKLQVLLLRALSRRACERLAQGVLGKEADGAAIARIVEQAAGHPLYLEELIRAIAEGRKDTLPETVLAMLIARLSQLDPAARTLLRAASVFGETFTRDGLLALLAGESTGASLDGSLALLVRAEFIGPLRERGDGGSSSYKFRHALVRDAAYSLLTADNQAAAHHLACVHLEQAGGVDPAVLAGHADEARDSARSVRHHREAGERAVNCFDLAAARRHAQRAIDSGAQGVDLGTLRAIQGWSAVAQLDLTVAHDCSLAAVDALPAGSLWWTKAIGSFFYCVFFAGRTEHAERMIGQFFAADPGPDARNAYLEAGAVLAIVFALTGMARPFELLAGKLSLVASNLDPAEHGHLHQTLGMRGHYLLPTPYAALDHYRRAVALFNARGERHWVPQTMFRMGLSILELGDFTRGEAVLREAQTTAAVIGDAFFATVVQLHLGLYLSQQADVAAWAEARDTGETYVGQPQLGPAVSGAANEILARVSLAAGDLAAAESFARAALASFAVLLPYRFSAVPILIEVLIRIGRAAEARTIAEDALGLLDALGCTGACEVPLRHAVARVRLADGDVDGAREALQVALARYELRVAEIPDEALRQSYLDRADNRELHALGRSLGLITGA
jgi:serine/threonine protein kinase